MPAEEMPAKEMPAKPQAPNFVDVHMREKGPKHLIDQQREYLSTLTITAALIAAVAMTAAHSGPQKSPLLVGEANQPTVRASISLPAVLCSCPHVCRRQNLCGSCTSGV